MRGAFRSSTRSSPAIFARWIPKPRVRGILLAALAYFILPLDTIPDFLLSFGFGDDIAVLMAAFAAVGSNITDAHRVAARKALADEDIEVADDEDEGPVIDGEVKPG